jgi:hypothetical protein
VKDRLYAYLVCSVLLGSMLAPGLGDARDDGFPFSTYPMFATARKRVESVTSALRIDAAGREAIIPAQYISSAEPMQAVVTLQRTTAAGRKASERLCQGIAERLANSSDAELSSSTRVVVVTRRVDSIAYLGGQTSGGEAGKVHAACKVPKEPRP